MGNEGVAVQKLTQKTFASFKNVYIFVILK